MMNLNTKYLGESEHERYLTEKIFKRPVFVTDYPKEIKAFYMKMNEDNKTVAAMDLLVPGIGEIIGGSQREDDLVKLEERITELGMKPEDYDFYLDLRKYGSTRHAGFGLDLSVWLCMQQESLISEMSFHIQEQ